MNKQQMIECAIQKVDALQEEIFEISHYIFAHPETAYKEFLAADRLEQFLVKNSFSVRRGTGLLQTSIKARHTQNGGLQIGFLSEYDALPIGHACGHNLIAVTGVAAAVVFDRIVAEFGLPADSIFLGTPAEEGGGGKIKMLDAGFFDDLHYAMMIHPADRTMVEDWSLAGQRVTMRFYGRSAHCAASPWLGANALEAAMQTFSMVNAWRCQFKDYSRVFGIVLKGGEATNVLPDYAEVQFNVRSDQLDYHKELMDIVCNCARCAAQAFGVEVKFDYSIPYAPIKNAKILEKHMGESFTALGETVMPRMRTHGIGSTDMGNVSQRLPAIHGHMKLVEANTHTVEFREAAGGKEGDRYAITATKAMVMTAIGLVTDPESIG